MMMMMMMMMMKMKMDSTPSFTRILAQYTGETTIFI